MIEYILNYLANRGVYVASQGEQQQMEDGIARYLQENGLEDGNTSAYYQKYVTIHRIARTTRVTMPRTQSAIITGASWIIWRREKLK